MPRRKGYGIPPTKRLKIDNEIENNENELNDVTSKQAAGEEIQKLQNENYAKGTSTSTMDGFTNVSTANSIKYLHKKFKKMAAVLSDDCIPTVKASEKPNHISESQKSSLLTSKPTQDLSVATIQSSLPERTAIDVLSTTKIEKCVSNNQFTISQNYFTAPTKLMTVYANAHCTSRTTSAPVASVVTHTPSAEEDANIPSTVVGRHACPYCKLVCNKPSVLQKHIRAHTNERPFPCLPCGFAFKTRSNLYKHRRSRSHSLKLEEVGADNKMYGLEEELCDEEDDSSQGVKDNNELSNEENKIEQPKKTIYKPKFHKAAIYIQNNATSSVSSSNGEQPISNSLNILGVQWKIPTTVQCSRSTPTTPSSLSGSSLSPEFLQRHISKLISQNQAIVETTDPFWSKKFYQRSKEGSPLSPLPASSSSSLDSSSTLKKRMMYMSGGTEIVEERLPAESKLAHALLQPKTTKSVSMNDISNMEELQPLNLSICRDVNDSKSTERIKESLPDSDIKPHVEFHFRPTQVTEREAQPSNTKFVRPTSLPLKPGTFIPKKLLPGSVSVLPLISPETPRPNKSYGQMYIGGNAYTYLGLKCSTRSTFCTLHKSQPTYVSLSPEHNKISMYSNWKVRTEVNPYLPGVSPTQAMSCYDSRQRCSPYTVAHGKTKDAVTHSSYWLNRSKLPMESSDTKRNRDDENKENNVQLNDVSENDPSKQLKICIGKIETSDEHYTYVRGRGRGKYVCSECGIRCRKPSMLKKHIRTHTDVRPYTCKHCVFSFKTKGNLTKHMKSKAHYKKCIEMGIVPVPTIVDCTYVDEEILSKQAQQIEEGQDIEETDEEDDDDDDDDDDENEDDFGDDDPKGQLEREVARSLLSLSKMSHQTVWEQYASAGLVPLNARPNTYPYDFIMNPQLSSKPRTPTSALISEQKKRDVYNEAFHIGATEKQENSRVHNEVFPVGVPEKRDIPKTHNEMFCSGTPEKRENLTRTPSPKRKNHILFQNEVEKSFIKLDRTGDIDSKENFALTNENEKNDCSTSVIILVGSPNSGTSNSPKRLKAEFISPLPNVLEDGRSKCVVCNKIFSKPSQLRLHVNIHYFEQPFRCESCAVSFRTKGHLHKHLSSNSHQNKVSMNSTSGGQTSSNNPRPFKCDDCSVGFRIHGHLAKHLRSKMHIMKLECLGKLPFGTYAEMERCGINMNDIDTTDCENSLESLQRIAKGVVNSVMYVNSADEERKIITDSSPY